MKVIVIVVCIVNAVVHFASFFKSDSDAPYKGNDLLWGVVSVLGVIFVIIDYFVPFIEWP